MPPRNANNGFTWANGAIVGETATGIRYAAICSVPSAGFAAPFGVYEAAA